MRHWPGAVEAHGMAGSVPTVEDPLLSWLRRGASDLPSERERWRRLLTDPSPRIRLQAEAFLFPVLHQTQAPASVSTRSRSFVDLPPPPSVREPPEPWRHCARCYHSEFWFTFTGEAVCARCHPAASFAPVVPM